MKRKGPDFNMRIGDEKASWIEVAKRDGHSTLAAWIKWVIRNYLSKHP